MENMRIITLENVDGPTEYVVIDLGNGEFTSTLKTLWDEQQAQKELGGTL